MNTQPAIAVDELDMMRFEALDRWHGALERLSGTPDRRSPAALEEIRVARYTFQTVNLMYLMSRRQTNRQPAAGRSGQKLLA